MNYIERIIQEELHKRIDEGFFDRFRNPGDQRADKQKRIQESLGRVHQAMKNVSGNLLNYAQTVVDYRGVKISSMITRMVTEKIAQISNGVNAFGGLTGNEILPDEPENDVPSTPSEEQQRPRVVGRNIQPMYWSDGQPTIDLEQPSEERQEQQDEPGALSPGDPINGPSDEQVEREAYGEPHLYLTEPHVKTDRNGNVVKVWFAEDDSSPEYESGKSLYAYWSDEYQDEDGYESGSFYNGELQETGTFSLVDDDIVRLKVLDNVKAFLLPCCDIEGEFVQGARRIVTTQKGKVAISGGEVRVLQKAIIKFIN